MCVFRRPLPGLRTNSFTVSLTSLRALSISDVSTRSTYRSWKACLGANGRGRIESAWLGGRPTRGACLSQWQQAARF